MAKLTYETIIAELKSGKYRPVYYLMGEESYYTDKMFKMTVYTTI